MADAAKLKEGREAFRNSHDAENHNRQTYLEDVRFVRENIQWDEKDADQRKRDGRPCLTINMLDSRGKQVVNDARMNKPSIQCLPADSDADPDTAEVMEGLIRNIEATSNADAAYDTATENAVYGGFGYLRVGLDYAYEDTFDMDLKIEAVPNPLSVYGDPYDQSADSANWNDAFIVDRYTEDLFKAKWGEKSQVDWGESDVWDDKGSNLWRDEKTVQVAEWWHREEYEKPIYLVSDLRDGRILTLDKEALAKPEFMLLAQNGILQVQNERTTKCHKVKQYIMSGAEILEENDWLGKYIPIVPVYGQDFNIEGKRYLRGLFYNAKDAQRQFNFFRSQATEVANLANKVPWIGPKGSFDHDQDKWNTANKIAHSYIEYELKSGVPPQRIPLDQGPAAGALQEAMNASEDIKATTGMYDASMGAQSNETSGKAIMARQREGDVSTFHFQDNMARGIRHLGRILVDLIPKVYSSERMIRVLGEDKSAKNIQLGQPTEVTDKKGNPVADEQGNAIMRTFDLTVGKYDVVVKTGPSFTTRREEAASQMVELIRAFPQAAPIVGPELAKNLDWPGADEIAEKMEAQAQMPDIEQMQQQMQEMGQQLEKLEEENTNLKMDQSVEMQKAENEKQLQEQKRRDDYELQQQKLRDQKEIEKLKIGLQAAVAEDNHKLAVEDHERSHDLEMTKQDAVDETGPDGKTKKKPLNTAVMNQVKSLREGQQELRQQLAELARIVSAPTELIRDPKTKRATGARKVMN
jgi:hypothetical protein